MANHRKYANLPDLDTAPDIFETPELTDDASTLQTSIGIRSDSRSSSHQGLGDGVTGVDRQRLDPDEARSHFMTARVDAREADFSDRIDSQRRSYQVSSRRIRKDGTVEDEIGHSSEEDEPSTEGIRRRIARLHKEAEELRSELERRQSAEAKDDGVGEEIGDEAAGQLDSSLKTLNDIITTGQNSAFTRLSKSFSNTAALRPSTPNDSSQGAPLQDNSYTITYAPSYLESHALAKAASFDTRLALLETLIGIDSVPLPTQDASYPKPILPTLDVLDRQLTILTSTSGASLEAVGKRVRQLTQEAEKLDEARRAARESQEALSSTSESFPAAVQAASPPPSALEDPEQVSKINALYGTLTTIESLAPILPGVLDRLRSLRLIHSDAANASQSLGQLEKRQAEMAEEIREWREGLAKVEESMGKSEGTTSNNMQVIEEWVKELEGRVQALGL